jgi:serine/threonine protein kinase
MGPSRPILAKGVLVWFFEQCLGLAEALDIIHNTKLPPSVPKDNAGDDKANMVFGRHGDIKPQNVLWFPNASSELDNPTNGILKLSDLGLTIFHNHDSRSNDDPRNLAMSPTYRAPEADVGRMITRKYDIWSLACTFLEFASWLLLGPTATVAFGDARAQESGDGRINEDCYFEVQHLELSSAGIAAVKPGVIKVPLSSRLLTRWLTCIVD